MDKAEIRNKNRKYISVVSVLSSFAVVMLHSNGVFWEFSATERYWRTANVIECVMYFAVPCFFMISGATLLDYTDRYNTKQFFIKRINKTVIPFLFWSVFGIGYQFITLEWSKDQFSFRDIMLKLVNSEIIGIYWFFLALFGLYLSIPVLAVIPNDSKEKIYFYFSVCAFVLNSMLPFLADVFSIGWNRGVAFVVGTGYLQYLTIGWLLDRKELSWRKRIILYVLGLAGLLAHIIGTRELSLSAGQIVQKYKGYTNVPCIVYSMAVFVFLKTIMSKIPRQILDFLCKLSPYTFGIYLLHWYILNLSVKYLGVNTKSIMYRIGAPFVVFPICVIMIMIIRKFPYGKRVLP